MEIERPVLLDEHPSRSDLSSHMDEHDKLIYLLMAHLLGSLLLLCSGVVMAPVGILRLFFVGFMLIPGYVGLRALYRSILQAKQSRMERRYALQTSPDEPWRYDFAWDPVQIVDERIQDLKTKFLWWLGAAMFLSGLAAGLSLELERAQFRLSEKCMVLGIILFGPLLSGLGYTLWRIGDLHSVFRLGEATLRLKRFPIPIGETLEVEFHASRPLAGVKEIACELRYVEEHRGNRMYKGREIVELVPMRQYAHLSRITVDDNKDWPEWIPISVPVPPRPEWTTNLSQMPPHYWELELVFVRKGLNCNVTFLLPIYSVPSSAA